MLEDKWARRIRVDLVQVERSFLVEFEPKLKFLQDGLPFGWCPCGAECSKQVAADLFRALVACTPTETILEFPLVEPAEKIGVVVLIHFRQPGLQCASSFALPTHLFNAPLRQGHD